MCNITLHPPPTTRPTQKPIPPTNKPYPVPSHLERDSHHPKTLIPTGSHSTWFVRHALKLIQDSFVSLQIQHLKQCNTPQAELKIQLISPSKSAKCYCYNHKSGRRKNPHETPPKSRCYKRFVLATNTRFFLLQTQFLSLRRYHL